MVSILEQMQVPNGTGPGVRMCKRPLLASRTSCKCHMETTSTFSELRMDSMEHLQGDGSQQGTLTLPDTWFRLHFWDLLMLQLLRPVYLHFPFLFSTFHPRYFGDFALLFSDNRNKRDYKNKTNYPISSNSHPSATANIAIHCLKRGGEVLQNQRSVLLSISLLQSFVNVTLYECTDFGFSLNYYRSLMF